LAQRSSRKRRKQRQRERTPAGPAPGGDAATDAATESAEDFMARGYARNRARDEAARAALKPLPPGERPTAVTVAAVVAGVFFVANLVSILLNISDGDGQKLASALTGLVLLGVMAVGMWRARYWAVLGMQVLLGISILFASLALLQAGNLAAAALAVAIVTSAGTLFWFLIKAMARIQMPHRPGTER
jgi:hypothetical protein